jgi:thiol-disulfide isomerase/thioredoxin
MFLVAAAVAGLAGFYFNRANLISPAVEGAAQRLIAVSLSDLGGRPQKLMNWRGDVLVVNFWATWCAPCMEEIPELMKAQRQYGAKGVKIVGIALDNADKVREFSTKMHIDYTLLIGGIETLDLARDLGNRQGVLPFSVVLDRSGRVTYAQVGKLTEDSLKGILAPLL